MFGIRSGLRSRGGFTLTELMIAMGITSLVMVALGSLQYISARTVKDLQGQVATRSSRAKALDQIRYRLMDAKIGSCVIGLNGHRIDFKDPSLGGVTSMFYYVPERRTLYYDENISDLEAAHSLVKGPIDISFELQSGGAIVVLKVKSSSEMAYADIDIQEGETAVYLRNP